jgi:hypothetical protein
MSDARLNELFAALNEDLPAAEFQYRVLRRIERAERMRYLVLATAAALGFAIAAGPLLDLLLLAARGLADLFMTLQEIDWIEHRTTIAVAALLALMPGVVRWLER